MTSPTQPSEPPAHQPGEYSGLLTQLMTNTMDADYDEVARTRREGPTREFHVGIGLLAVVAVFGLMLGVSAIRTEESRPQADAERAELVDQIHVRQTRLDAMHRELTDLQDEVTALQKALTSSVNSDRAVAQQLTDLGVDAGSLAVTGPGVVITADDADSSAGPGGVILDSDLQALANALWQAGAEAIAIDGHRLTSLTSIRYAGEAITVGYRSLTTPYVLTAIGDPDTIAARLLQTPGGQGWVTLRNSFGITFDMTVKEKVNVAAAPSRDQLLYARLVGGST
jgi:uncharacterized protein YlxW (UPF0749 family)